MYFFPIKVFTDHPSLFFKKKSNYWAKNAQPAINMWYSWFWIYLGLVHMRSQVPLISASPNMKTKSQLLFHRFGAYDYRFWTRYVI